MCTIYRIFQRSLLLLLQSENIHDITTKIDKKDWDLEKCEFFNDFSPCLFFQKSLKTLKNLYLRNKCVTLFRIFFIFLNVFHRANFPNFLIFSPIVISPSSFALILSPLVAVDNFYSQICQKMLTDIHASDILSLVNEIHTIK